MYRVPKKSARCKHSHNVLVKTYSFCPYVLKLQKIMNCLFDDELFDSVSLIYNIDTYFGN